MSTPRRGLGRGLGSLIPTAAPESAEASGPTGDRAAALSTGVAEGLSEDGRGT